MTPSDKIDALIAGITDWRGKTFAIVRKSILAADPEITEDWKWMGSPVWYRDGIIAVANAHKKWVKVTFAYGAYIPDPDGLFNAGLDGNMRRAIDYFEGDKVDEAGLKKLIRVAIAYNQSKMKKPAAKKAVVKKTAAKKTIAQKSPTKKKASK